MRQPAAWWTSVTTMGKGILRPMRVCACLSALFLALWFGWPSRAWDLAGLISRLGQAVFVPWAALALLIALVHRAGILTALARLIDRIDVPLIRELARLATSRREAGRGLAEPPSETVEAAR
ncbi:MAG: hypothetical protein FJ291_32565 [Planctomycetes bacterium]|nr:hypothetical protein [Planctomycetota bacterium]